MAALSLWRHRLPPLWRQLGNRLATPPVRALSGLHSGHIGDYVTWLTIGVAALGGVCAALLR